MTETTKKLIKLTLNEKLRSLSCPEYGILSKDRIRPLSLETITIPISGLKSKSSIEGWFEHHLGLIPERANAYLISSYNENSNLVNDGKEYTTLAVMFYHLPSGPTL